MPKIKNIQKTIDLKGGRQSFEFEIHYTTTDKFFGKLPKEFFDVVGAMPEKSKEEMGITTEFNSRYDRNSGLKVARVKGTSEEDAERNTLEAIRKLSDEQTIRRAVILVFFKDEISRYSDSKSERNRPAIESSFSFKYTTEVKVGNHSPKFFDFSTHTWKDEVIESKSEVTFGYGVTPTIIDDTPENREFLEKTYDRLKSLNDRLKQVLNSEESILTMVAGGQLLLKNGVD